MWLECHGDPIFLFFNRSRQPSCLALLCDATDSPSKRLRLRVLRFRSTTSGRASERHEESRPEQTSVFGIQ